MAEENIWQQLRKKDDDLLLAAELGKALLEKNEELTKQNERIVEEYSTKLEVSEQYYGQLSFYFATTCVHTDVVVQMFVYILHT